MRFVAQYPGFVAGIRAERSRLSMDGSQIMVQSGIQAEFKPEIYNQHDLETALQNFQFKGLFQHEDEATPVGAAYRISIYDTDEEFERRLGTEEEWDLDTKALVEQRLLGLTSYGRSFVVVPEQTMEPPWPKYLEWDGTDADELVILCHDVIGVPFEDVLAYEASKWGPRREDVIVAFQEAIEIRDAEKVIVG